MSRSEKQYLYLLEEVYTQGKEREDRTGVGTRSIFGHQMRFDLSEGFPLLTTKKLHFKSIAVELLWFLRGDTNTQWLNEHGVSIWDEWADGDGDLGPVYGHQWCNWEDLDGGSWNQLSSLIGGLKDNPFSRRHIVSAWNVNDLPNEDCSPQDNVNMGLQALAPCHVMFQFYVEELSLAERIDYWATIEDISSAEVLKNEEKYIPKYKLSCQLYQRSGDVFLGVPYNIASYALLTHMIAQQVNMVPGEFIHTLGDAHLYLNHLEQAEEQLMRDPDKYELCQLKIDHKPDTIFDYNFEDFELVNYQAHPHIKAPVAI